MNLDIGLGISTFKSVLVLTSALAWNSAIRTSIDYMLPQMEKKIIAEIVYALTVTIFVIATVYIISLASEQLEKFSTFPKTADH
jgi:hypothetical protein